VAIRQSGITVGDRVKRTPEPWSDDDGARGTVVFGRYIDTRTGYDAEEFRVEWNNGTVTTESGRSIEAAPLRCFDCEQVLGECMCAEILHVLGASGIFLDVR